jgi:hypothetical protein
MSLLRKRLRIAAGLWAVVAAAACAEAVNADALDFNRNYTYIYFENGYPTRLKGMRRAQSQANTFARENPDLVVQTGFYSLRFDCDDMLLTGYDALQGSDYVTALNEDVTTFSPAELSLRIVKDGTLYTCVGGTVQSETEQHVRLIESGQVVQRFDHVGLIFKSEQGAVLEKEGRFEVTAWPDHVVFALDFTDVQNVTKTEIELTSPGGKTYHVSEHKARAVLMLQPHLDQEYYPLKSSSYIREACALTDGKNLETTFDEAEAGLRFDLPMEPVKFPRDIDRLDEFEITVKNFSSGPQNIPLIFNETRTTAITGTSMLLCEEDGRPSGIPVQISKNWHRDPDHRVVHEGSWLRGYAVVPMRGKETRTFRLRVVTGYWGGVPAVSVAQLCLIGYGGNWKWDESGLGCWGESMCYDPSQHLGSSFVADVRAAFTAGKSSGKTHEWTENMGGGDFLVYTDRQGTFHWGKRLKTAYHWTGPNMTEVLYSGVTDDDKIRFNYRVRSVRTGDYHRRFHAYKYEFLERVSSPETLVFHQWAADYYNSAKFDRFHVGDQTGLKKTLECPSVEEPISFQDAWLAFEDHSASDKGIVEAKAYRGLLSMSSQNGSKDLDIYLHLRTSRGCAYLFDVGLKSLDDSFAAGDVVTGQFEFIMPPKEPEVYWGADSEFKSRLKTYEGNAWQAVADEYKYNVKLSLLVHTGKRINDYPVEIQADPAGAVLADFTVKRGGIGYVPMILRGVPQGSALKAERFLTGKWIPLEWVDHETCDYYQGFLAADGTQDCVFNIARPSKDLTESWRIRILNVGGE